MSRDVGMCRFENGEVLYFVYDGTVDRCDPRLSASMDQAHAVNTADRSRGFPRPTPDAVASAEPVHLVTFYGKGSHWRGTASRASAMLVEGRDPYACPTDEDGHRTMRAQGIPEWAAVLREGLA